MFIGPELVRVSEASLVEGDSFRRKTLRASSSEVKIPGLERKVEV